MNTTQQKPVSLFCCYASEASEDATLCSKLNTHLDPLRQKGWIQSWQESNIRAGANKEREIETRLRTAQVILLLVSPDFLASESCKSCQSQMKIALERFDAGEAIVIPILLRFADWKNTPLQGLQMLPRDGRPIANWSDKDEALLKVVAEIEAVVKTLPKPVDVGTPTSQTQSLPLTNPHNPYMGPRTWLTLGLILLLILPVVFLVAQQLLPKPPKPLRQILTINISTLSPQSPQCTSLPDNYQCTITLSASSDSNGNASWSASIDRSGNNTSFDPESGILVPGQSEQVTISGIPCIDSSFAFSGGATTTPAIVFWKCAPAQERLDLQPYRLTLTIDPDGLLNNSQGAIDDVKRQVQELTILNNRSVALAVVYAGTPDVASTPQALKVSNKIYDILRSLASEGGPFQRASFYGPLYQLGSPANIVYVDVFLYVL